MRSFQFHRQQLEIITTLTPKKSFSIELMLMRTFMGAGAEQAVSLIQKKTKTWTSHLTYKMQMKMKRKKMMLTFVQVGQPLLLQQMHLSKDSSQPGLVSIKVKLNLLKSPLMILLWKQVESSKIRLTTKSTSNMKSSIRGSLIQFAQKTWIDYSLKRIKRHILTNWRSWIPVQIVSRRIQILAMYAQVMGIIISLQSTWLQNTGRIANRLLNRQ